MQLQKKRIKSIQFGLFSPQELRASSVVRIDHPETLSNQAPKEGGLIDLRLGTTERQYLCATCAQSNLTCVGHFGHIELTRPVFHVGYMNKIKKLLETVCFYCSRIKAYDVYKEHKDAVLRQGLSYFWGLCKGKTQCMHCQSKQPLIKRDGLSLIAFIKGEDNTEGKVILNGERVHTVFKRISAEECEVLGFDEKYARPEWMIISVLNVPPPAVRPSVVLEGMLRGEDDLTHKLADIVKANANLAKYEREGAPGHIIRDYESLLQYHVATLMDNNIPGLPQSLQKSGRPLKSLSARLKGKEGRVRGNLMGKRVDFSARSVISPDSNISLCEVGVPESIAKVHTFPEQVMSFNKARLEVLVRNGPNKWPGANFVTREDGQRIDLRFNRNSILLTEGCVVERHMMNGDVVLFNRQPSLHKMSMMAHRVRIMKGKTFRLNLSVTSPYNADFDGDEMNLHMPQSYNTRAELENICGVDKNVLSCQGNKPVMGIVQDSLVGVRKMTDDGVFVEWYEGQHLLYKVMVDSCYDRMGDGYVGGSGEIGRNVLSGEIGDRTRTIEEMMNGTGMANEVDHTGTDRADRMSTTIDASNTIKGPYASTIRPAVLRPRRLFTGKQMFSCTLPRINYKRDSVLIKNGILIKGCIDKKVVGTSQGSLVHVLALENKNIVRFFDGLQRVVNGFLLQSGFTMGVGDTIADERTLRDVTAGIQASKNEVNMLIDDARNGRLRRMPGMNLRETFESRIGQALNKARDVSGSSANDGLGTANNVRMMVMAGSKGSLINISQMTACVGQQNVEGHRIAFSNQRTLPHFHRDDDRAQSRGFVENSYLGGLRAHEFFFHAMGGREGLIDTAVKTAETGYIQRRLIKSMENCQIAFDGSVRSERDVICFLYGDDGFDGSRVERVEICGRDFYLPFNFERIYEGVCGGGVCNGGGGEEEHRISDYIGATSVSSTTASHTLPNAASSLPSNASYAASPTSSLPSATPQPLPRDKESVLRELLTFSSNRVFNFYLQLKSDKLRCLDLRTLIRMSSVIREKYYRALVCTGEMVGTLASQSIGEPATQMTLNTFHYAGIASTITMGVPRLKELINVAKNIKTPSMLLTLKNEYNDLKNANLVKNTIEYKEFKHVIESISVVYDPNVTDTLIEEDKEFVRAHYLFPDEERVCNLSPWVLRVKLSRNRMVKLGVTLEMLRMMVKERVDVEVVMTDENAADYVMRMRMVGECDDSRVRKVMDWVVGVRIGGVKGISRVYLLEEEGTDGNEAGTDGGTGSTADANNNKKWKLQTSGTNLIEILHNEYITDSYSNDLMEVCAVLGIEAARNVLIKEIKKVIESDGSYVNQRHLMLLGDIMTSTGVLLGITRHGFNKKGSSCLMRCTFEETVEILLNAAAGSEHTNMRTISESVMSGQIAALGTGNVELLLDVHALGDKAFEFEHTVSTAHKGVLWSPESGTGTDGVLSPSRYTPRYTPVSPTYSRVTSPVYSPKSPSYMPTSPKYVPMNAKYALGSSRYSPTSPTYSPDSPRYNPGYTAGSPQYYSRANPSYSPTSVRYYSPTSTRYVPGGVSPLYGPASPKRRDEDDKKKGDGDEQV
ncbi:hypothetical protein VCUG_02055 [Vavraia culicis subsp. floridensis]|uniref:DNA-directed RNA polymerase subunit n=1 Tax=Vavraia culicis (isolate floridensis) TaxID=948595 RepID=L2GTP5_VAVCU|nr:uncharacterized protein VCUG_02055 [Vavraia culicis subsp. floridensis]ELA46460.1 hypothetical protein VCUG_02055 [Vavraia culicis subsp. floridensis]